MPLYDAHCPGCGWEGEALQPAVADRVVAYCERCKGPLEIAAFGRPAIHGFTEHFDRGLGEIVKSRAHKKALLKEKGFVETGGEIPSEPTRPRSKSSCAATNERKRN
jgi:hypothetical protein